MRRWHVAALLLAGMSAAFASASAAGQVAGWDWPRATMLEVGIDPDPIEAFDAAIRNGRYGLVDRLVIVRNRQLVVDASYDNDYQSISRGVVNDLGCGWDSCDSDDDLHDFNYLHPDFHPWYQGRRVHSLQSVTKSIASTVLAAAIHRGELPGIDATLVDFLKAYDLSTVDSRLHQATLADLLTMRSGIEWHEQDRPLGDSNTTIQLERSNDWVQFTLDQPMDAAPGDKWVYNSGGSHLISAIVRAATGVTIADYAEQHLFGPLGITDYYWKHTPAGLPDTEGGLYLDATDLAKVGLLMLQDGRWTSAAETVRLLPAGWAREATERQVDRVNGAGWGYGYQWWRPDTGGVEVWAAMGFGDQYLLVLPEHDLIAVVNSWNLFDRPTTPVLRGLLNAVIAATRSR
ncbi:MAG: serine hydrolase [Acidobacteria bacterium]|nr:serine hydrolase [Acidobacteriota bacterium]